jgi:hypothetical protein
MHAEHNFRSSLVGAGRFSWRGPHAVYVRPVNPGHVVLTLLFFVLLAAGCGTKASAPSTRSVQLSWPASPTLNVTYKVYRCGNASPSTAAANCVQSSPGNFTTIASVGLNVLTFTDSKVSSGQTYFYAATAVDSNSVESVLSAVSNAVSVP